jgi:hypothetical protein
MPPIHNSPERIPTTGNRNMSNAAQAPSTEQHSDAVLLLGGCAHCNSYIKKDPPPGK